MPKAKPTVEPPIGIQILTKDAPLESTESLLCHPRNVNEGSLEDVIKSIRQHGFYGTITVQLSTRHVLAGNHRLKAAVALEMPLVPVTWVDVDDELALRIVLVDNETTRKGKNNDEGLKDLLLELSKTPTSLTGLGYGSKDLENLLKKFSYREMGATPPAATANDDNRVLGKTRAKAPGEVASLNVIPLVLTLQGDTLAKWNKHKTESGHKTDLKAFEALLERND
jgi:ParB-like nuclease domain